MVCKHPSVRQTTRVGHILTEKCAKKNMKRLFFSGRGYFSFIRPESHVAFGHMTTFRLGAVSWVRNVTRYVVFTVEFWVRVALE